MKLGRTRSLRKNKIAKIITLSKQFAKTERSSYEFMSKKICYW